MPIDVVATVLANARLSDDYNVLTLDAAPIARAAAPGQFVMIRTHDGTDPLLRRPFSIFQIIRDGTGQPKRLTILNKRVGRGTALLFSADPGAHVACLGPLGRPFETFDAPAEAWLVAGGVGLAPFATVCESLRARGTKSRLFYGARTRNELFFVDELERIANTVVLSTEDGSEGVRGRVTVPLEDALRQAPRDRQLRIYACGPTPMMKAVAALAVKYGRPCTVSLEQVMGCGLGGCYSCVVSVRRGGGSHYVRSCVDGPVFDAGEIEWEKLTS